MTAAPDTQSWSASPVMLDVAGVDRLIGALRAAGYTVLGPTVREGAIAYDEIRAADDLPVGWTDEQEAGSYRLVERGDDALFGYVVGPHAWKRFLHPPEVVLWSATRDAAGYATVALPPPPQYAFFGARPCELAAIGIQDEVFLGDGFRDQTYAARRAGVFVVAVNCVEPGGTCFCTSMGTGPRAGSDYDLVLTEIVGEGRHEFLVEVGTEAGAAMLEGVDARPAAPDEAERVNRMLAAAAGEMGRSLDTDDIKDLLYANLESPHWENVAQRCLACTNCTMVCPTCFCATVEDRLDLSGTTAERVRRWDSCFTLEFSYIHGGALRSGEAARYRQWMTHKLASWIDQFGTSGCVGCGRCITWCPVGIDITAEAAAIRAADIRSSEELSHADG